MGSSIVTFGTSTSSKDMTKKVWYLILSNGSQYDSVIDTQSFRKSALKILIKENTQTPIFANISEVAEEGEDDYGVEEEEVVDIIMDHVEEDVDHDNVVEDGDDIGSLNSSGSISAKKGRPADTLETSR